MNAPRHMIAAARFGYGLHPGQRAPQDAADLMEGVFAGADVSGALGGEPLETRAGLFNRFVELRRTNKDNSNRPKMKKLNKRIGDIYRADVARRIAQPIASPHGFYERLAWFWGDHFAVAANTIQQKAYTGRFEADAIRPHIAGRFSDMLRASSLHPAMLLFLNQNRSAGPNADKSQRRNRGLNENLAREIIELHTLGVGADYTQTDVRQFAELLTGLTFRRQDGEQVFRPGLAEPGAETVLGRTYGGAGKASLDDILAALDDMANHPATARHIAWKLARHFIADDPPEDLVRSMERAFTRSRGDLPAVYEAMLDHPESWASYGAKVKQPFDFVVSSLRAVGARERDVAMAVRRKRGGLRAPQRIKGMNQSVYQPPGPHGWPEEAEAWITPQGLAERLEWASVLGRYTEGRVDPRGLLDDALAGHASEETRFAATRAAERWEGIAFVLASPEFNRR